MSAHPPTVLALAEAARLHGRSAVRWALASGRWQRPHPGVVVLHSGPLSRLEELTAAVLAGPRGSVLGGLSAAELHGLRGFGCEQVHVLIGHRARPFRVEGVIVHRSTRLSPEAGIGAPPRTRVDRSIVDAACWAPSQRLARAMVLASIQQRLTTPMRLSTELVGRGAVPRAALLRESIRDAAGGIESLPERDFALLLRRHRLPTASHQTRVRTQAGRHRLDVTFDPWRVTVEIDGAHHRDVAQSDADLARQNELVVGGRGLLRFSSYQVRHESTTVAGVVARALRAAGWR